jgi:hypothetical protein
LTGTSTGSIQKKFTQALDDLVAQVKEDVSILAAILCGSLSHDTVWAKSDIGLALVIILQRLGAASCAGSIVEHTPQQ